ncbi:MAG: fibrobacter succinogenes major paralogous domain-containing protein [Paludibacteraceae bacterium]|nr:fibrobacter succinogenes major paralogous domain-containing protein [Paludibacteraceae bacterium]
MKKLILFILSLAACVAGMANDCSSAIPLSVGTECSYTHFTLSTGCGKVCTADCGWVDMKYREVWLTAEVPSTGRLAIATEGRYLDGFMAIYRGTCGNLTPYRCSTNGRLPEVFEVPDLPAGEKIYIRVALVTDAQAGVCAYQLDKIVKPKCSTAAAASDYCSNATLIQSPEGYCGNTGSQYSVDAPGNLQNVFCGSIENNSWLQFVAAESDAELNIFVSNCQRGIGIQMRIYSTDDCIHFNPYSNCWNPAIETNGVLKATGLTPGKRYYLMIDGYAGDVCDYTISGGKGIEMPQTYLEESICKGRRYQKNGFDVSEEGVYRQELKGPNGKDSLVVLSLSVIDPVYSYLSASIYSCERYTQNGFDVNTEGKHYITRTSAQGCDSIVELDLRVIKQKEHHIYASICDGEVYEQNGFKETKKGVYTRRLKTAQGCDSVVTLNLDVTATIELLVTGKTDICNGDATVLTASGGNYYKWYDASGNEIGEGETLTVNPSASTTYKVVSSSEQKCPSSVTDCQGNTYRVVRIGEQCWMAENLRCTKYDTESPLAGYELPKVVENRYMGYSPAYYLIPMDEAWYSVRDTEVKKTLTHLYNWGAAMGLTEKGSHESNVYMDVAEDETFQGICPNGWHVPSLFDYYDLVISVGLPDNDATALRAKNNWYRGTYMGEKTIDGLDTYGFSLYPGGVYNLYGDGVLEMVGYEAFLWCCGPASGESATYILAKCNNGAMLYSEYGSGKYTARSVRCVKN